MGDSPIIYLLVLGVAGYFAWQIYLGYKGAPEKVCKSCGFIGEAGSAVRGSLAIEIILWLCFILPGLIYSIWRASSRHDACPKCGSSEVIPADSPIGRQIIGTSMPKDGSVVIRCEKCGVDHNDKFSSCPRCGHQRQLQR